MLTSLLHSLTYGTNYILFILRYMYTIDTPSRDVILLYCAYILYVFRCRMYSIPELDRLQVQKVSDILKPVYLRTVMLLPCT